LANYLLTGFHLAPAWWNGVMALFLALLLVAYLYRRLPVAATGVHSPSWLRLVVQRGGNALVQFFSLDWAKRLFAWLYRLIQRLIGALTVLLEGDGGVLWAMVLLAMMITLVFAGGGK
jgi:hypothetical protein